MSADAKEATVLMLGEATAVLTAAAEGDLTQATLIAATCEDPVLLVLAVAHLGAALANHAWPDGAWVEILRETQAETVGELP